jgi:hypothetical protein
MFFVDDLFITMERRLMFGAPELERDVYSTRLKGLLL